MRIHRSQSDFGKVYLVKGDCMKKLECAKTFPWCVGPFSSGLDLQELPFFCQFIKGENSVKSFFTVVPPLILRLEFSLAHGGPDH